MEPVAHRGDTPDLFNPLALIPQPCRLLLKSIGGGSCIAPPILHRATAQSAGKNDEEITTDRSSDHVQHVRYSSAWRTEIEMTGFGSPCGACKFLRRKCVRGCVFAPYFCHEQGAAHFAAIHKVFGASNVSKLLAHLPLADRPEAAVTISYEAQARLRDPIYGCVAHIFALQQQVRECPAAVVSALSLVI
jgi:hypothetical protein